MAASDPSPMLKHLHTFLEKRHPPKTFCPSEVVRAMSSAELQAEGAQEWRDLMPTIRELAWQMHHEGQLEILQKGQVLDTSAITLDEIRGPIRLRRVRDS